MDIHLRIYCSPYTYFLSQFNDDLSYVLKVYMDSKTDIVKSTQKVKVALKNQHKLIKGKKQMLQIEEK